MKASILCNVHNLVCLSPNFALSPSSLSLSLCLSSSGLRQRKKKHSVTEQTSSEDIHRSFDSLDQVGQLSCDLLCGCRCCGLCSCACANMSLQGKLNVVQSLQRFLNKYGFRCINEQKLEENSLHDDPGRARCTDNSQCV